MTTFKSALSSLARRFGYHLVPEWGVRDFPLEHYLRQLFENRGIDCVIDVGANAGQYGRLLRQTIGYRGRILSFEPNPEIFARLRETIAGDPGWQAFNIGLGDRAGSLSLNVTADPVFSSFLAPDANTGFHGNRTVRVVEVPVERLDAFLPALDSALSSRIYLKMDTQGYDLSVFSGCTGIVDHIQALQSEMSVIPIYQGMANYQQAISAYEAAGYNLAGLFPVGLAADMRAVEFDGVFCRPGTSAGA